MPFSDKLAGEVREIMKKSVGSTFWVKKTIISGDIKNSVGLPLTGLSDEGGELLIENIILKTDTNGLILGKTFRILEIHDGETRVIMSEKIANLGSLRIVDLAAAKKTMDAQDETTANVPYVLGSNRILYAHNEDVAGSGVGTMDIYFKFRKLNEASGIEAA